MKKSLPDDCHPELETLGVPETPTKKQKIGPSPFETQLSKDLERHFPQGFHQYAKEDIIRVLEKERFTFATIHLLEPVVALRMFPRLPGAELLKLIRFLSTIEDEGKSILIE